MRKKFFAMFLVGVMMLGLTACGGKETNSTPSQSKVEQRVEENVISKNKPETVVEKEAAESTVVKDTPVVGGSEVMNLTDTTIINLVDTFGFDMELPVYTKAEIQMLDSGIAYIFTNKEGNKQIDRYTLTITKKFDGHNAEEDGNSYIENWYKECQTGVEEERYASAHIVGDADSKCYTSYYNGKLAPNGDWMNVQDIYRMYDRENKIVLQIKLFVEKDASLYGDDILEKSTADYREQLRATIENLAN